MSWGSRRSAALATTSGNLAKSSANYLREVAAAFHGLYNAHKLVDGEHRNLSLARISLAEATRQVIANGLDLLGVSAPESM